MSRDTTRHGALDTAFGLGRHGWQGESKTDCREGEWCNASHGIYLTSLDVKIQKLVIDRYWSGLGGHVNLPKKEIGVRARVGP